MQHGILKLVSIVLACLAPSNLANAETAIDWDAQKTELVVSSAVKTDFLPEQLDIDAVTSRFDEFFRRLAAGELQAAYDMQTENQKLESPYEEWVKLVSHGLTASGDVARKQLIRITWYPDSPASPSPGLNVALDYAFWGSAGDFQCGYIVLYQSDSEIYSVSRIDQTHVPDTLMIDLTSTDDLMQKLPCYLGPNIRTTIPNPQ